MSKMSLLNLILLAAAAVTAAILPKKYNDLKQANSADNATLRSLSGDGGDVNNPVLSCVWDYTLNYSCHVSLEIFTVTSNATRQSDVIQYNTYANTSESQQGTGHAGNTTSVRF